MLEMLFVFQKQKKKAHKPSAANNAHVLVLDLNILKAGQPSRSSCQWTRLSQTAMPPQGGQGGRVAGAACAMPTGKPPP